MKALLLASALTLVSTATFAQASTQAWTISLPAKLQDIVVADLQNASADAKAHNDTRHGPCWDALIPFIQSGLANPLPNKPGLFLLIQKGFDFSANSGQPLVPTSVASACGPVALDLKISFATLFAKIGFVVSPIKLPF